MNGKNHCIHDLCQTTSTNFAKPKLKIPFFDRVLFRITSKLLSIVQNIAHKQCWFHKLNYHNCNMVCWLKLKLVPLILIDWNTVDFIFVFREWGYLLNAYSHKLPHSEEKARLLHYGKCGKVMSSISLDIILFSFTKLFKDVTYIILPNDVVCSMRKVQFI